MCTISRNKFKRRYLKNKRLVVDFLLHFWNVHAIYNILKKKDEYPSLIISEIMDFERDGYLNVSEVVLQKTMR